MTIAHSARKIIKTQRFIFRALPALLVSAFVLNACAGAVPVTVSNSSLSEAEIAKLRADAKQANDAKETADLRITELEGQLSTAKGTPEPDTDKIKELEGQLATAIGERNTANGTITTLRGQLSTAIGERDTSDGKVTDLQGELSTAQGERDTANGKVTDLQGQLSTAIGERDTSDGKVTDLQGQLSTAQGERDTANGKVTTLQGQLSTAQGERDTANGKVTTLQGQLSTAQGERDTANGKVTTLQGQLSTAQGERDTANMRIETLEGEATQAGIAKMTADSRIEKLEEQIRLIEDARISFIDWAGTAEAPKTTVIDSAGTGTLPLLNGAASVRGGNLYGNFIQGLPIVAGQGFDFTGTDWADSTVFGDVLLLGENSPSGVAFSHVFRGRSIFYAGLLPTTNLGAPITDINTDAIWDAKVTLISFSERYSNSDFKMRVTFDGSEGTINSGTVSDGVFSDGAVVLLPHGNPLNIQGRFGTDGLLYGTVELDSDTANGTLTGLIGVDGAVGAFVRGGMFDGRAGGFVAYPTDPRITELEEELRMAKNDRDSATGDKNAANLRIAELEEELRLANEQIEAIIDRFSAKYSNWMAAAGPDATADTENPRSQFLQTAGGIIDTTEVTRCRDSNSASHCGAAGSRTAPTAFTRNLNNSRFDGRPIGGDINDGYARFSGYIGETFFRYAGILDSTDLGAPLTGDTGTSVQWNGSLDSSTDFVLTITFESAGGRLDAFINRSNNQFYRFQNARFDTGGVITGTINYQGFTDSDPTQPIDTATDGLSYTGDSVLSGIIGQEGVVAVFVGADYGGFVASPDITFNPAVTKNDWTHKVGEFVVPFTSVPRNQFLNNGGTTGIRVNSDGTGRVTAEALNLGTATFNGNPLGGNPNDRIRFFSGYNGDTRHYYAGFSPAGLGATLPAWETGQPTSAEWKGQLSVLQGANARENADLTLEVNFENRRLTAFVPVGANHYLLDAGFNADDDGFFAGTVNFGAFTDTTSRTSTNTLTSGVLTGLIGAEGAMGVFVSGSSNDNGLTITGGTGENGFAGGFVACPYDETGNRCQQ